MTLLNLVKWSARLYFKTCHDFKVEGLENIPKTGALIIAGNHLSNADPPAIGGFAGLVRDSRFVAKKNYLLFRYSVGFSDAAVISRWTARALLATLVRSKKWYMHWSAGKVW